MIEAEALREPSAPPPLLQAEDARIAVDDAALPAAAPTRRQRGGEAREWAERYRAEADDAWLFEPGRSTTRMTAQDLLSRGTAAISDALVKRLPRR